VDGKVNARGVAFAAFRKYFSARMRSVRARVAFANARAAERYFLFFSFHFRANKGPRTGGLPFLFLSLLKTQSLTRLSPLFSFAHEQVMYSLTKIKGIGRRFANIICKKAEIDMGKRAGELSAAELESLMVIVSNPRQFRVPDWFLNRKKDIKDGKYSQLTSNQLDTKLRDDIERLKKMRNHRGLRHYWGIKVRGQHTKTTGRRGKLGR